MEGTQNGPESAVACNPRIGRRDLLGYRRRRACANPSGGLAVRATSCNAAETVVDPVALGLVGPSGADGVSGWELVTAPPRTIGPGQFGGAFANCPAGKRPIGGGFYVVGGEIKWYVIESSPRFNSQ